LKVLRTGIADRDVTKGALATSSGRALAGGEVYAAPISHRLDLERVAIGVSSVE